MGKEEIRPIRAAAKTRRKPHQPERESREHRDFDEHVGAKVVCQAKLGEVDPSCERKPVFVMLRPQPGRDRLFPQQYRDEIPTHRPPRVRAAREHEPDRAERQGTPRREHHQANARLVGGAGGL